MRYGQDNIEIRSLYIWRYGQYLDNAKIHTSVCHGGWVPYLVTINSYILRC